MLISTPPSSLGGVVAQHSTLVCCILGGVFLCGAVTSYLLRSTVNNTIPQVSDGVRETLEQPPTQAVDAILKAGEVQDAHATVMRIKELLNGLLETNKDLIGVLTHLKLQYKDAKTAHTGCTNLIELARNKCGIIDTKLQYNPALRPIWEDVHELLGLIHNVDGQNQEVLTAIGRICNAHEGALHVYKLVNLITVDLGRERSALASTLKTAEGSLVKATWHHEQAALHFDRALAIVQQRPELVSPIPADKKLELANIA